MRYEKGTIQISPARDIPLLQQVLRSGFATSDQLYEFMQLNQSERSRQAFDHRLRRLLAHGLIEKHQGAARGRPQVFVISKEGASLLIDVGELFAGRIGMETGERSCAHWLDLNDLHLALAKNRLLMRWTPASEICSQNDLTQFRYAKDYDAVVAVECGGQRNCVSGSNTNGRPRHMTPIGGLHRSSPGRRSSIPFCIWSRTTTFCA